MSRPRYDWWGYVKGMIRRYPELCALYADLKTQTPDPTPGSHGKGRTADPTASAALRQLPPVHQRELEAVQQAIAATRCLPDGPERLRMARMVFWERTHTLDGAAMQLHRCRRTVVQWHGDLIREVARGFGLLD